MPTTQALLHAHDGYGLAFLAMHDAILRLGHHPQPPGFLSCALDVLPTATVDNQGEPVLGFATRPFRMLKEDDPIAVTAHQHLAQQHVRGEAIKAMDAAEQAALDLARAIQATLAQNAPGWTVRVLGNITALTDDTNRFAVTSATAGFAFVRVGRPAPVVRSARPGTQTWLDARRQLEIMPTQNLETSPFAMA